MKATIANAAVSRSRSTERHSAQNAFIALSGSLAFKRGRKRAELSIAEIQRERLHADDSIGAQIACDLARPTDRNFTVDVRRGGRSARSEVV